MKARTEDMLLHDQSRCNNHRCKRRMSCRRYMQLAVDYAKHRLKYKTGIDLLSSGTFTVTRFDEQACQNFIEI